MPKHVLLLNWGWEDKGLKQNYDNNIKNDFVFVENNLCLSLNFSFSKYSSQRAGK